MGSRGAVSESLTVLAGRTKIFRFLSEISQQLSDERTRNSPEAAPSHRPADTEAAVMSTPMSKSLHANG